MTIPRGAHGFSRVFSCRLSHHLGEPAGFFDNLTHPSRLPPGQPIGVSADDFQLFFAFPWRALLIDRENYGYPFPDVLTNN